MEAGSSSPILRDKHVPQVVTSGRPSDRAVRLREPSCASFLRGGDKAHRGEETWLRLPSASVTEDSQRPRRPGPPSDLSPSLGTAPRVPMSRRRGGGAQETRRGGLGRGHSELLLEAHAGVSDQAERRVEEAETGAVVLDWRGRSHPALSPFNPCRIEERQRQRMLKLPHSCTHLTR